MFFQFFFLLFFLAEASKKHTVLDQDLNQKQIKTRKWQDLSNKKFTHGPKKYLGFN
jgi:hypothetical protein